MKRFLTALTLSLTLAANPALAASPSVSVDGTPVAAYATVRQNTTYVALRPMAEALLEDAAVSWEGSCAAVRGTGLDLTASPGALYLESNGRALYIPYGVLLESGRTLVPVRVLAAALGAEVEWDSATGHVNVTTGTDAIPSAGRTPHRKDRCGQCGPESSGSQRVPQHHLRRDFRLPLGGTV